MFRFTYHKPSSGAKIQRGIFPYHMDRIIYETKLPTQVVFLLTYVCLTARLFRMTLVTAQVRDVSTCVGARVVGGVGKQ
jgi:hypothetical protein